MNINNFTNSAEILQKGEKISIDKKDFVDEHEKLVDVLNSPSHEDDKKEANEQQGELDEELDKKDNVKKSIMSNLIPESVSKDDLVKSHISSQFGYSENLKIDKKGSVIKERLLATKEAELLEANEYQSNAVALKTKIGSEPTEMMDGYISDGIDVNSKPKVYPWGETYCNSEGMKSELDLDGKPVISPEQEICDTKRQYNRCVEMYVRCQAEIKLIDTMVNNLTDDKIYSLSVKQATTLGF